MRHIIPIICAVCLAGSSAGRDIRGASEPIQVPSRQPDSASAVRSVEGAGIRVTLIESDQAGRWHRFQIERAQAGRPHELRIERMFSTINRLWLYGSTRLIVAGLVDEKSERQVVVDLPSGRILSDLTGHEFHVLAGGRYVQYRPDVNSDQMFMFDVESLSGRPITFAEALAARIRGGTLPDKEFALRTLQQHSALQSDETVRQALLEDYTLALNVHMKALARRPPGAMPSKEELPRELYFVLRLIPFVKGLKDPRFAALLARTDVVGAAASLWEREFVPILLQAWDAPTPPGYSARYRAGLLEPLLRAVQVYPDLPERSRIAAITRAVLARPHSPEALIAAMELADELDDDEAMRRVKEIAEDPTAIARLGLALGAAETIQEAARRIMSRRITIGFASTAPAGAA